MTAVSDAFAAAKAEGRALLIGYLPAGFPSATGCAEAFAALADAGVDVFELGLPYTDPLMDGPVIQAAVERSLAAGTGTDAVLETVHTIRERTGKPVLVMTYWNPVERYGVERFAAAAAGAGATGVITPDLIPDEADAWRAAAGTHELDTVFIAAPSSTDERLRVVGQASSGFVYAASTLGVTGVRSAVSNRAAELVERLRRATDLPVAVGLGVSSGAQALEVAGYADGVIVGSAFVRPFLDGDESAGRAVMASLAAEMAAALR